MSDTCKANAFLPPPNHTIAPAPRYSSFIFILPIHVIYLNLLTLEYSTGFLFRSMPLDMETPFLPTVPGNLVSPLFLPPFHKQDT